MGLSTLWDNAIISAGGNLTERFKDKQGIKAAEWYNFTNMTFTLTDANGVTLDVILPYSHKVRNMDYPATFSLTNTVNTFEAAVMGSQDGTTGEMFFLYDFYDCPQVEAQEAYSVPSSTNYQLDASSGIYYVYGIGHTYLHNTCRKVKIKNRIPFGFRLEVIPYTIEGGQYVQVNGTASGKSLSIPAGQEVEIKGAINRLDFGGSITGLQANNLGFLQNVFIEIEAYYDTANPGLPPISPQTPTTPSLSGVENLTAEGAFLRYDFITSNMLLHNAAVGASASDLFSLSTVSYNPTILGNQKSLLLGIVSSESYTLYAYGAYDTSLYYINPVGVQLANAAPATPTAATPALPTTGLDNTQYSVGLMTFADTYDLIAKVGYYPAYVLVFTNESGTNAATLTVLQMAFNDISNG